MSEVDEVAQQQPLFDSESARREAARGLGIEDCILPAVGVVIGGVEAVEPASAIDEPPKLTDDEWLAVEPVLKSWEGIKKSRVNGRAFIDLCLRCARLDFHWTLLETEQDCEACRKRSERMCLSAVNRWAEILDVVGDSMRPEVFELLRAWKLHGNGMRNRVVARREKKRRDLLTK